MKHFFYSSIIIFISSFFIFNGIKEYNSVNIIKQKNKKENSGVVDTSTKKVPDGYKYISNFKLKKNKKTIGIEQDADGIMLFLNSKGVTFFDGQVETELFIDDIPNAIKKHPQNNLFYVACKNGFGVLTKSIDGDYSYQTISDVDNVDNYHKILQGNNKVYFISEHKIIGIDQKSEKNIETEFTTKEVITGTFILKNKLYFSIHNKGLNLLENKEGKLINNKELFANLKIIFSANDNDNAILGLSDNMLYTFDGKNAIGYETKSNDYIKESVITDGFSFNEEKLAILTLNGGAIIINKKNGETFQTINYRTGLPDDEIYAYKIDRKGGFWLSHDYGISRIAFDIPVFNYSFYPGLEGKINSVKVFDSTLYVATGEGLFKLKEAKDFAEVEVAIKKKVKSRVKAKVRTKRGEQKKETVYTNTVTDIEDEELEEDGGFLSRWKKRRAKRKKEKAENFGGGEEEDVKEKKKKTKSKKDKKTATWKYKTVYKDVVEYRKIYELQSVKYSYKKVEGINSKCKQLKEFANGLLVSTNSGLFFTKDDEVKTIISDAYIYNISGGSRDKILFVASSKGLFKVFNTKKGIVSKKIRGHKVQKLKFKSVFKASNSLIWTNTLNNIYKIQLKGSRVTTMQVYAINSSQIEKLIVTKENDKILFFTSTDVYYYNSETDKVTIHEEYNDIYRNSENLFSISDGSLLITGNKSQLLNINTINELNHFKYVWLVNEVDNVYTDNENNIWAISSDNSIFKIIDTNNNETEKFDIYLKNIFDSKGNKYTNYSRLQLESKYKTLTVKLSSPSFLKKDFIKYFYSVDNANEDNFIEANSSNIVIQELNTGEHTIYFQAINDLNEKSKIVQVNVNINPPFWQTKSFIVVAFFVLLSILATSISLFFKRKQKKILEYNKVLEINVKERTFEIQKQNTQIQSQLQKIDNQNKEITGSIRYASRIQKAALPNTNIQKKYISGYFNLFRPRDIVSGDFYWMSESQNKLFIAAVDCTGHGVPGGFLSMLGISFLNDIIIESNITKTNINAADVLNVLRKKVIETLSGEEEKVTRDGMDMSLAIIDKENMEFNFAGANNPAYIVRKGELTKVDADRMPIGYNKKLNDTKFSNRTIKIEKDDLIYLFSDGYADQFGGKFNRKFNSRRFRELLLHLEKYPMEKQRFVADAILNKWMGDNGQIDDVLLIGIKI